ncbi:LPS assembly protein LptD [Methylocystis sp. WRRC1]|uniref:LPS-assembly protein LptD n=1 Tax=Methylocystis sp. WRRC1 TaxID=1732014 RepID=UPI001D146127|nr:LPS assembly protein LptD [Methylocystis sp. WRRC1]MCC3247324.1 LPS assembly protein LptD [Methylocystis sp. WRRC1]
MAERRQLRFLSALLASASALAGAAALLPSPALAAPKTGDGARMVVEAKEMVYDEKKNTVTARGDVQIYYKGRLLEADRVVYDRNTSRVFAEGHAKLTETNGTIARAERFDLTDDFKQGFVDSLQVDTTDNTHFSSPRAERSGDTTTFDMGTYTACEACKDDPSKPRMWQVRAKRIIHDNVEKMIYYEDASFEMLGTPIAYVPFWSSPDPSVKRKSGFLTPQFTYRSQLGMGFGVPYFWAIAPDYDLTITPTVFTRQGPYLTGEFRKRFDNGGFTIRAEGTHVGDPGAFAQPPLGAGDRRWRGSIHTFGDFAINDRWRAGWDITALSDRYFLQDYKQYNYLLQNYFFRETSSTAYLTGQGPRSFFDMRGYYFQGLSPNDVQAQQSVVHPVTDYNRVFDIDPAKTGGVGGQVELDANVTSTSAQLANYESINPRRLDVVYGLYNVCSIYSPLIDKNGSQCLLRGVGGDYQHATISANWKRKAIDPVGGVWTGFAFARFVGSYLDYDRQGLYPIYSYDQITNTFSPIPNANQAFFVNGSDNRFRGQALPGVGAEWRYPILARSPLGNVVFEPIVQLVARPNQTSIPSLVNMDAQSLVFDDSTLFEWSKFSGYDRFETGTRLNYGGQATLSLANGGFINAMFGQSRQIAGNNSYSTADAANVGLNSGLDSRTSDLVGRLAFAPASWVNFVAKGRFDKDNMQMRRLDLLASFNLNPISVDLQYANYSAQPAIGFDVRRQGMSAAGRYDITKNYFMTGSVTFDMSRYLYNRYTENPWLYTQFTGINLTGTAPLFSVAALGAGVGYHDECTTLMVNYSQIYQPQSYTGLPARNQTVMVSLNFRTLGEARFNYGLGSVLVNDGVRTAIPR